MRSRFRRSVVAVAVCGTVAVAAAARAAMASSPARDGALVLPAVVIMATPAHETRKAEPHPEIADAIRSLERAKAHLQAAAHDYNGHRVDAIAAIDAALRQLHTCKEFDR